MRLLYEQLTDIPIGFTEVEYLASDGNQYIDTEYKMQDGKTMSFNGNIMWTASEGSANFFYGYRSVNSAEYRGDMRAFFIYGTNTNPLGRLAIRYGVNTDNSTQTAVTLNTKFNISFDGINLKVNGTTYATLTQAYTPANYKNMWLFNCNTTGYYSSDVNHFIGRVYNWQIWSGDTMVRDYIPCLDNNNVPCLYDKVEGKAYYNQGTGTFSYGRKIIPVEYLESTGTQYINTGFYGTLNTKIEAKVYSYKVSGSDSGYCIAGDFTNSTKAITMPFNFVSDALYSRFGDKAITTGIQQQNGTYTFAVDKAGYYVNGAKIANFNTTTDFTTAGTIMLLGFTGLGRNYFFGKMYYCKIYDNGVIVRDFIPCKDENNVGYMFDKVTHTCYLNAGTGSFVVGEELPKQKVRFLQGEKARPYYCEVDYLQSTGAQYIDTGYKINTATDEVTAYFQLITTEKYYWLMGEHDTGARFGIGSGDGTNLRNIAYGTSTYKVNDSEVYNNQHYFNANSNGIYVNGTLVHAFESFSSTSTIYLFNLNISGGGNGASGRIWRYTHKRNGVLIRDLIPVLDWSYTPCMYDKVTGQLFYNQGTGTFSYGREIHYVEYLESTGTQYIDTGVILSSTDKVTCVGAFTGTPASGSSYFFGTFGNNKNFGINTAGIGTTETWYGVWANVSRVDIPHTAVLNEKYTVTVEKTQFSVNETVYQYSGTTFTGTASAYLFWANGTSQPKSIMKMYDCKMWQNSILVRNFIPAIDQNGVGYMFDAVTHSCYLNAGTGNFKYPAREVEYLSSTGSQYIDTGFKPDQNTKLEIVAKYNGVYPACVCACRWSQSPTYDTFGQYAEATKIYAYWGRYSSNQFIGINKSDFDYTKFFKYIQNKNVLTYEGLEGQTTQTHTFSNIDFTAGRNLTLFFFSSSSSFATKGATIKYCKLWDNGIIVRNLVPCFKDGVAGMLDKISNIFYANGGSGTFTTGKIVERKNSVIRFICDDVPSAYQKVSYIESTGTQYIDTGVYLTNNHSVEIDYQLTVASQSRKGLYGGLVTNGARHGALTSPSNQYLEAGYGSSNVFYQLGLPDTNRHVLKQAKNKLYFDNELIYTFGTATFTQNFTAPLGNFNYTNYNPASAKYYGSRWWDGDTLVRDLVPVVRKSDSVAGMWDRVTKQFFTNAGTGDFTYG